MSLKVYGGFRYLGAQDLLSINRWLDLWYEHIQKVAIHKHKNVVVRNAIYDLDVSVLQSEMSINKKVVIDHLQKAAVHIQDRQKNIHNTNRRDPEVDFSVEVVLIPHKGDILGIIYSEQPQWVDKFMADPLVFDYRYTSQTDGGEVSDDEWERRSEDWHSLFKGGVTPGELGLSRTLSYVRMHELPSINEMPAYFPSFEKRLKNATIKEHETVKDFSGIESGSIIRYLLSDEYKNELEEYKKVVAPRLLSQQFILDAVFRI